MYFLFSVMFSFLVIFLVLQCAFLSFHFSVFLAIIQVKQCLCLIFHVFQFSLHYLGPTVCFYHFSSFPVFLTAFHILQCVFLIFHDIQFFSPYSRSSRVHFSFSTFFSFSRHIPGHARFVSNFPRFSVFFAIFHIRQCVFLIFHDIQFSHHIPGPT